MKRFISLLTVLALILTMFSACNADTDNPTSAPTGTPTPSQVTIPTTSPTTVTPPSDNTATDFKAAMDSYEAFIIEYVDFMNTYLESNDPIGMLMEYATFLQQYTETMQKIGEINTDELSADDYAYYVTVQARITARLLEIGNPGSTDNPADTVSPDFKAAMDSYEAFITEYVDFMNQYLASDDPLSLLDEYTAYMQQYTETMQKISEIDSDELSAADYAYYVGVQTRITAKLLEVGNPVPPDDTPSDAPQHPDDNPSTTPDNNQPVDRRQEAVAEAINLADLWFPTDRHSIQYRLMYPSLEENFDAFSEYDAAYAIDHADIDWQNHALYKAFELLADNPIEELSQYELYDYIENCGIIWGSTGFTDEEVQYAVYNCGINWYERAISDMFSYWNYDYSVIVTLYDFAEYLSNLGYDDTTISYAIDNTNGYYRGEAVDDEHERVALLLSYGYTREAIVDWYSQMMDYSEAEALVDSYFDSANMPDQSDSYIGVADAISASVGDSVTVKGIVGPSLVNQSGFYLIDETGVIAILTDADTLSTLEIGYEIILEGERYYKGKNGTLGNTCIRNATVHVNNYGSHEYSTASFDGILTLAEFYALDVNTDYSTSVFTVTATVEFEESPYYTNLRLFDGGVYVSLYYADANQYSWLKQFAGQTITMELAPCNWSSKPYYAACVLAVVHEDGSKTVNTLNFD